MAHNVRTRNNVTEWGDTNRPVTAAEMDQLDKYAFQSINGDIGGVWAPQNPIQLGGAGLIMLGTLTGHGSVIFDGDEVVLNATAVRFVGVEPTLDSGVHVTAGPSTFDDNATFNDQTEFWANTIVHSAGYFHALGDAQLGSTASNALLVNATTTFQAAVTLNLPATFNEVADFNDTAEFLGTDVIIHTNTHLTCNGSSALNGNVVVSGSLTANAAATFNSTAEFWQNVSVHSAGYFHALGDVQLGASPNNACQIYGQATLHEAMLFAGAGRVPFRPLTGPNSNATYRTSDGNVVFVPNLTADRTYSISDDDAGDGDFFLFGGANGSGGTLTIFTPGTAEDTWVAVGGLHWALFVRVAGSWQLLAHFAG